MGRRLAIGIQWECIGLHRRSINHKARLTGTCSHRVVVVLLLELSLPVLALPILVLVIVFVLDEVGEWHNNRLTDN